MTQIETTRTYLVVFIEGETIFSERMILRDMVNPKEGATMEYHYSMMDKTDKILDLRVGERLIMNFSRDNSSDSSGMIKRIA